MSAEIYTLSTMPRADRQVRDLLSKSSKLGTRDALIKALRTVKKDLTTNPSIGDPERRTNKQGGMIYHLIVEPVIVHYVVFESEKATFLLDVKPLARFFPE